jgi:nitrate/TMAO reductase-like tetraheme cytochrome c subunit
MQFSGSGLGDSEMTTHPSFLALLAIGSAVIAATIIVVYLVRRPSLVAVTKLWLVLGLGVFPLLTAGAGNIVGFEATKERSFCASCHVMTVHTADSDDPASVTLSSRHARNKLFGAENCYTCHADYGMYGTILTKWGGLKHVYNYYLGGYHSMTMEEAKKSIHINKPYPNENCMQCHSTKDLIWASKPDHKASLGDDRAGKISCASGGCHGFAHPYWLTPDGGAL